MKLFDIILTLECVVIYALLFAETRPRTSGMVSLMSMAEWHIGAVVRE